MGRTRKRDIRELTNRNQQSPLYAGFFSPAFFQYQVQSSHCKTAGCRAATAKQPSSREPNSRTAGCRAATAKQPNSREPNSHIRGFDKPSCFKAAKNPALKHHGLSDHPALPLLAQRQSQMLPLRGSIEARAPASRQHNVSALRARALICALRA